MTLTQVWGSLIIFLVCPLLGGLPLIQWITYGLTRQKLSQMGTGNVSVSAAFYHGGKVAGILAVLSEALKGIAAVLIARAFFPNDSAWELIALIALVMGRYWMGKGAGTTNVVWGIVVHDPITAGFVFFITGISFTIFRDRETGKLLALFLLALILTIRHSGEIEYVIAAIALASLLFWIYQQIPDDLDLTEDAKTAESQAVFRFFQGNNAVVSLNSKLNPEKVGQKAATLSQLKQWGFFIPQGWVLPAGEDSRTFVKSVSPSEDEPFVVRSSAVGEDSPTASAAGQYVSILNITSSEDLEAAILECQASYHTATAVSYRRNQQQADTEMAVLIQKQILGVVSGVAFSRDPMQQQQGAVIIESLPGDATQVVSGQFTPQQYQVYMPEVSNIGSGEIVVQGEGNVSPELIKEVALIARDLEGRYHGIPQDIEWTYDGEKLWVLQARPISTLQPIWTRKIAAEVIPGFIRPLTWSINRPLTCGVWGDIFKIVLGNRATGLDFTETATLHYSNAYFNATLLGKIFQRMGLPAESLEFLTRGAKFTKPPLVSTLRNVPGLLRLLGRERRLDKDFDFDYQQNFAPTLDLLAEQSLEDLSPKQLLDRIDRILLSLKRATYYSILVPLSLAARQAFFKVNETELDNSQTPEVSALRSLAKVAYETRNLIPIERLSEHSCPSLFVALAEMPDGETVIQQFNEWLEEYGYLSEVATDIAVPRWKEDPRPVRELFAQCLFSDQRRAQIEHYSETPKSLSRKAKLVQKRLNLKGQVTEIYSQLLAHLRWSFLALESSWLKEGILEEAGDIFFLEFAEIEELITLGSSEMKQSLKELISKRKSRFAKDKELTTIPYVVYGNEPLSAFTAPPSNLPPQQRLQGIPASPGEIIGRVRVLRNLSNTSHIDENTILVVPYTDSGWSPVLSQAGGLIAEVGGKLSHGAIVAREYGIPAIMDIPNATSRLKEGQRVQINGHTGIVELLEDEAE